MENECNEKRSRVVYYDAMRILAAALVIFNHLPGYTLYQHSGGGKAVGVYVFDNDNSYQRSSFLDGIGRTYAWKINYR